MKRKYSAFSKLTFLSKKWYKRLMARRNRRGIKQAKDIREFRDKPLDPWALD
jgi:hypothetical protein